MESKTSIIIDNTQFDYVKKIKSNAVVINKLYNQLGH